MRQTSPLGLLTQATEAQAQATCPSHRCPAGMSPAFESEVEKLWTVMY